MREPLASSSTGATFDEVVRGRRAVRTFRARDVAPETIEEIVDLARHAPSSMNGQPWHFVVIREAATKAELVRIKNRHCPPEKRTFPADFLASAPVVLAICVEKERAYDRGLETGVLATAIVLLAARERGLASVYLSARQPGNDALAPEIRALLGLPDGIEPITLVPLGYPGAEPEAKVLRDRAGVLHHERFGNVSRSH